MRGAGAHLFCSARLPPRNNTLNPRETGGWGRLVLHSAAAGVYFALTGCLRADTPRTSCINTTWEILYREYTSTIERFCCSTRRYCMRRIILCVPHRARTGPAQGQHRAHTGPVVKTHTILQAASGVQEEFYLLQVKSYSGARSSVFLQRALCGPCAGPVRALCGPCVGRSPVQIMRKNHLWKDQSP